MRRSKVFGYLLAVLAFAITVLILFGMRNGLHGSMGAPSFLKSSRIHGGQYSSINRQLMNHVTQTQSVDTTPDRTIDLGVHIENVHQLSLKDKIYWMEGWYWLKWPEAIDKIIKAEKIPLDQIVEFTNVVEETNLTETLDTAEPLFLAKEGHYYQLVRFSGRFYVNDLDLRRYPFVSIELPLTIETKPDSLSCYPSGPPCVALKPESDVAKMMVGQFADINGYDLKAATVEPFLHQYNTTFGVGELSAYESVDFNLVYKSNFVAALAQFILPLLVIIGIVLVSPSLPSAMGDVRLAIPTTALLTLIFLQQGYQANLPSLSYLTFLDWLYLYAYFISIAIFILFCWSTNCYNNADEAFKAETEMAINAIDKKIQTIATIVLIMLIPFAWFFE
jgi:hypothetical protein